MKLGKKKSFILLGYTEWNNLNKNNQLKLEKQQLYKIADAFFTASENDNINKKEEVLHSFGEKTLLHSLDIHGFDKLKIENYKCFTWIKADPTFEGLKQIIWEPKERIKIQDRNPNEPKTERIIISNIKYKLSTNEKTVNFNKDLNSIIGARGSGKSTLLKNMAYKIDSAQFLKKENNKLPYLLEDFSVSWLDGQKDDGSIKSPKNVFYVPQNYLSSIAYDDGEHIKDRDIFLTDLLKKNMKFAKAIQSFDDFSSKNKIKIEEFIQKILTANNNKKELEISFKKQGSKDEIKKEIVDKKEEVKKYKDIGNFTITEDKINKYSQAQTIIISSEKKQDILNQDKLILDLLKKNGANILISDNEFSMLSNERQELIKKELNSKNRENINTLIDEEIGKIITETDILKKAIEEQSKEIKELGEQIKKSKALEDITKEISTLQGTLEKIDEISIKLEKSKKDITDATNEIADAYIDFEIQQNNIYKTIKFDEKFFFLKIDITTRYNTQEIKNFIEKNINTRDSDPNIKIEKDINTLFGEDPQSPSKSTIKKVITGLINNLIKIKVDAGDLSAVLSQLLKNRHEIDYLNSVKNGDTCFKDMTGGQKAIALLELIFKFDDDKYPILIDQPEDDLDVSGVATDLVNFIKKEKQNRQIIIVTHNASLVVCADSEEVIRSSNKRITAGKYDFSYETGSIENPERREDIIEILEGGRDALKMRTRKLNFKYEI